MKKIKLFVSLLIFIILLSCGYEPVYSKKNNTNQELLSISVENIKDRSGQILRNSLLDQLNPDEKRIIPKYRLEIKLVEGKSELGYRKDMSATRADLTLSANYFLRDIKSGNIVLEGNSQAISSYDVVESIYATLIAEKDAREKSLNVLSETIVTEIVVFFKN